jgi:hypothetical protein
MMRNQRVRGFKSTGYSLRRVEKAQQKTTAGQGKTTRILLIASVMLVVFLVGMWASVNLAAINSSETGSVSGLAVDERHHPVQADVSILKTDLVAQADVDGVFKLDGVPAGAQHVIVAYKGVGHEIPVVVEAGKTAQIGTIRLVTTQMAP